MNPGIIRQFWEKREFKKVLSELPSLRSLTQFESRVRSEYLNLYAKVYLQISQKDLLTNRSDFETAISLSLTSFENSVPGQDLGKSVMMNFLGQLCEETTTQGSQPGSFLSFLARENQALEFLKTQVKQSEKVPSFLICTPKVAHLLGLSKTIFQFLAAHTSKRDLDDLKFIQSVGLFSSYFEPLNLALTGDTKNALAKLGQFPFDLKDVRTTSSMILGRVGQLVFFHRGIETLRKGELRSKKYLVEAISLIRDYQEVQEKLASVIYDHPKPEFRVVYASVFQSICELAPSPILTQATFHVVVEKIDQLLADRVLTVKGALKIVDNVLILEPENESALELKKTLLFKHSYGAACDAVSRGQYDMAFDLMSEVKDYFFLSLFLDSLDEFVIHLETLRMSEEYIHQKVHEVKDLKISLLSHYAHMMGTDDLEGEEEEEEEDDDDDCEEED